jgi:5-methylcytosine-specific restriction enzyme A
MRRFSLLPSETRIKTELEKAYSIPFVVKSYVNKNEPVYSIGPQNSDQEYFTISVSFHNQLRLILELQPEKYASNFIESLSNASVEKKSLFCSFAEAFRSRKAKLDFSLNRVPADPFNWSLWPENWLSIALVIKRMPIVDEDVIDYCDLVCSWGTQMMGMILSLAEIVPLDSENIQYGRAEGAKSTAVVSRYERNPLNRVLCLVMKGYTCFACGFNFKETYGPLGQNYIHVHHIIPVSQIGDSYYINPATDLVPVCPNCHAMLHRKDPPMSILELKSYITGINN